MATLTDTPHLLITGATGGLGQEACEMALDWGYKVTAVGRNKKILDRLKYMGCHILCGDLRQLTDPTSAFARLLADTINTADVIWHCAARSSPWGDYEDFYTDNVQVTEALATLAGKSAEQQDQESHLKLELQSKLQPAARSGVKTFVHVSTPSIYFDYQHRSAPDNTVKESYRPAKYVNHYANTKAQAEARIHTAATKYPQVKYTILRPRAIFGRYDQVLLPRLMRVLKRSARLPLPRGGKAVMDFTYAGNVVHAMQCATQNERIVSGSAFNVSNHQPMALAELIKKVFVECLNMPLQIKALPYPVLDKLAIALEAVAKISHKEPLFTRYSMGALNYDMVLDNTQAKEILEYTPVVSMNQSIDITAQYIQSTQYIQ